ncbi:MAG TPA: GNAT family N-acetyltransferase [Campylobacterales bacterium]|nr:GNAT family N-acetyltransferase [Campylobacterales bacterium]HHS92552.1 GNAT family N-acetyltransferase [Campylobacterales bacterium]
MEFVYELTDVAWDELSELYKIAPLGNKKPKDLKIVFENSRFKCFVYDTERLIGVGRALADGLDCSYICDVAVHPEYQGQGIGKKIISQLIEFSEGHKKIILYAVPGKESFYGDLGFAKMNTAMAIFQNQDQAREWKLVE